MSTWLRKVLSRPTQAHAFIAGADASACGVGRLDDGEWRDAPADARRCMTCRRKVEPDKAPKAPRSPPRGWK